MWEDTYSRCMRVVKFEKARRLSGSNLKGGCFQLWERRGPWSSFVEGIMGTLFGGPGFKNMDRAKNMDLELINTGPMGRSAIIKPTLGG
ncbi:hypothetical protein CRG98_031663 [Punica granatum]|uniref:Uncharacterized protein n=1 Tax=Punica granatum TaxID=22663 RepID=A0A2I0IV59_PUNGR|nr:hypothetical protein CRG98_031663 [Punica granatum]